MQISKEKLIYLLVFTLLSSLLLGYAQAGYPLFGGDSYSFLPTTIHLHNGEGLINELYKPTGSSKVLFYPPLFQWFQSLFIFTNKANAIYYSLSITSILCLFFMMLVFYKSLKTIQNSTYRISIYILLMFALSTSLDTSSGRPEILVNLLLSITLVVYVYQLKFAEYVYGVLLVLIGICSPITGVYCSLILLIYYIYKSFTVQTYAKTVLSASTMFILFLIFYPYSFFEMIKTMIEEANKIVFARDDSYSIKEFVKYHLLSPSYTFYILLFFSSVMVVIKHIYKSTLNLILLVVLMALISYFGFRNLSTNYYVYNLSVLYFLLIISLIPSYKKIVILMLLFCSIGYIRRAVLFSYFYDSNATVLSAQENLHNYRITNFKDNSSMWLFYFYQNNDTTIQELELHQQMYSSPMIYDNIKDVVYNHSKVKNLKIAGLTIANNPPFYYYKLSTISK